MKEFCSHCSVEVNTYQIKCNYCGGKTPAADELPEVLTSTTIEQAVTQGKLKPMQYLPVNEYFCDICWRSAKIARIYYGAKSKKPRALTCFACNNPNSDLTAQLQNLS